ncbi:programmed cell death 1 ligand 1-like isoform X2 [Hippocampus comes]|uniref:programmed cell death 1 ligand 1-like isoform X2 n=1 Tax=Hippocampus comes TaxID=109280 RepID=UPI00094E32DA|nr:PREDICTED: programmed cell death 1 ligand 1-like isoform X2 [Hippocampus comes]
MNWTKVFILQLVFQPCLQVPLTTNAEQASYRGELGGDVMMGCRFHPLSPHPYDDLMMAWYWISGSQFREVYRLDQGKEQVSFQHPDFRGRARVLMDGIKDGWARLQVSGLRINDTGIYQCVVRTRNGADFKDIKLSVTAPYKTVTKSISKSAAGGELVLSCQSEGYPVSTVAWEDAHGQKLNASTAVVTTADHLFSITTQVRVGSSQKNNYTCSFHSNSSSANFLIPDETQLQKENTNNANVTQIAFGTCIGIALIGLIIVLIHLRRKGFSRKEQKTSVTQLEEQTCSFFLPKATDLI